MSPAENLAQEHERLLPGVVDMKRIADSIGEVGVESLRIDLASVHEFVNRGLFPHAVAEGRLMYPIVRRERGTSATTVELNSCHVELARLADELDAIRDELDTSSSITAAQEGHLRAVLYGMHALAKAHFAEEEEVYVSTLASHLSPEEARTFFEVMERRAEEIRDIQE